VTPAGRNRTTGLALTGVIVAMLGLTAAAVPLYDWFCRVTGFGGTTQRAETPPEVVRERVVTIRFNADIARDLPWSFQPEERALEVHLGDNHLAFYRATNLSDRPLIGSATFNVTPHKAGPYFAKIHCFCFEEQRLEPGETVEMPVSFFVDPAILDDPDTRDVHTITLSYTFFRRAELAEGGVGAGSGG
jgi:cytochrome c oxidase assembly protein subunit 11